MSVEVNEEDLDRESITDIINRYSCSNIELLN